MKLKSSPGDFRVDEVLEFEHDPNGPFYVHRLEKRKLDTSRALAIVAQLAGVDRGAIAYAGLKDRQGVTTQWISVEGRAVEHVGDGIRVRCVGRSARPIDSRMSAGNRFTIVVRDLDRHELESFERGQRAVERFGFPNYFDDQRFGCVRHGQGFVMRDILAGRFEDALRNLVARPSPVAVSGGDVALKVALQRVWGDWDECARIARGPVWKRLFEHLQRHPRDARGAIERLPARMKLIHAFAFQSLVWNRAVDLWLRRNLPPARRLPLETIVGPVTAWRDLPEDAMRELARRATPLFGPDEEPDRLSFEDFEQDASPGFREATYDVLDELGVAPEAFALHRVQGMNLRTEPRAVLLRPYGMRVEGPAPDRLHRGRRQVTLRFGLPRGAYATMLTKRLFAQAHDRMRPRHRAASGPRGRGQRADGADS